MNLQCDWCKKLDDGSAWVQKTPSTVTSFNKKVNPQLAKRPLKTNGRLSNRGLTSLVRDHSGMFTVTASSFSSYATLVASALDRVEAMVPRMKPNSNFPSTITNVAQTAYREKIENKNRTLISS